MLDNNNTANASRGAQTENGLGLKGFNRTGREEAAAEVLRPKQDPAVVRRNILLIGIVLIAFCVMGYVAYQRSGLSFIPQASSGGGFGTSQPQMPAEPK
jgi:hypothetical protein